MAQLIGASVIADNHQSRFMLLTVTLLLRNLLSAADHSLLYCS